MDNTKYMLITVDGRAIYTAIFDTRNEANRKMVGELKAVVWYDNLDEVDSNKKFAEVFSEHEYCGIEFGYRENDAWVSAHNRNYDWKIVPVMF